MSNAFPDSFVRAPGSSQSLATLLGQNVTGMDRNRHTPYAQQWNLNLQHSLPGEPSAGRGLRRQPRIAPLRQP